MNGKKQGILNFFNNQKKFGKIIVSNKEKRIDRNNFLYTPYLDEKEEKVFFNISRMNGNEVITEVESDYAYYFRNNVLTLEENDFDQFYDKIKEYAEKLKKGRVTTSMIRKVYDQIRRAKEIYEIKRLRPKFAYIAGRNEDTRIGELMYILDCLAKEAKEDSDHLKKIKDFMEAIVAYRKYVGEDK